MAAALTGFARMGGEAKMVILGDMRELGDASAAEHQTVVDRLPAVGCQDAWLVGPCFAATRHDGCRVFPDVEAVKEELRNHPQQGRLILIKGSHGTRLFELADVL